MSMIPDLSGKTALITGSTSGIGLHFARSLARAGCNIILNGFGEASEIEHNRQALEKDHGVKALYHGADMSKPEAIVALMAFASEQFGAVDILINNAGIQKVSPIETFPDESWEAIIAINLSACFYTIKQAVPMMKEKGWGRIINLASVHGLVASPYKSAYVAAKHGVLGLTKAVALELAETPIRCNAICPGYVKTPLVQAQIGDTAKARGISEQEVVRDVMLAAQPTKEFITYEQLAGMLYYLCSEAGAGANGTSFTIDGGWTAK